MGLHTRRQPESASGQRAMDFPRAAKLRTLERAALSGPVKSLLKALDGFARDAAECTQTLRSIGVSMGVSASTAKRAAREAQRMGTLEVFGCPEDGRSNLYRIKWDVVFSLPDAMARPAKQKTGEPGAVRPRIETPVKPLATPVNLDGDPGQIERVPRSTWTGTPVNLTGVSATDHTDKETATIDQRENQTAGGGGLRVEPSAYSPPRSGSWAWTVTRNELGEQASVVALFDAAVKAGLLVNAQLDQIRFLALTKKIRAEETIKNPTGYLVRIVETAGWNYLPPDAVRKAWQQLRPGQPPPTGEQLTKLRTSGAAIPQLTKDH